MSASDSKRRYQNYDFEKDDNWLRYKRSLEIPADVSNEAEILDRLKQKWYKKHIDPNFEIDDDSPHGQPSSQASSFRRNEATMATSHRSMFTSVVSFFGSRDHILLFVICLSDFWLLFHTIRAFLSLDAATVDSCFRRALWGCISSSFVTFFNNAVRTQQPHPNKRLNLLNPNILYLLYCFIFLLGNPLLVVLLPPALHSIFQLVAFVRIMASTSSSSIWRVLLKYGGWFESKQTEIHFWIAYIELMTVFFLIFQTILYAISEVKTF
jgi:hypothetical protein